jgi:hypothetical protein
MSVNPAINQMMMSLMKAQQKMAAVQQQNPQTPGEGEGSNPGSSARGSRKDKGAPGGIDDGAGHWTAYHAESKGFHFTPLHPSVQRPRDFPKSYCLEMACKAGLEGYEENRVAWESDTWSVSDCQDDIAKALGGDRDDPVPLHLRKNPFVMIREIARRIADPSLPGLKDFSADMGSGGSGKGGNASTDKGSGKGTASGKSGSGKGLHKGGGLFGPAAGTAPATGAAAVGGDKCFSAFVRFADKKRKLKYYIGDGMRQKLVDAILDRFSDTDLKNVNRDLVDLHDQDGCELLMEADFEDVTEILVTVRASTAATAGDSNVKRDGFRRVHVFDFAACKNT